MGYQVTGVDLSTAMMKKARMKAEESNLSLNLIQGDAECLPFQDEIFDIIVNRHLIWALISPEIALQEWHRVLKKGGKILIIDDVWNDRNIMTRVKR